MRKTLVAAVALAPLCLAASRGLALATDTISSGVNSPVQTATATGGAPDSIDIVAGGSVTVTGTTPAVTLNSGTTATPNNVGVEGAINITGVNNSVGLRDAGGGVGSVTVSGTISNSESYSPSTNSDGFSDTPFASVGSTGRFGIQVFGTTPAVGDIDNLGTITVKGDLSAGVSIEGPLTGSLFNSGTITYVGDSGAAIRSLSAGSISGDVNITGPVSAQGTSSSAINLAGDVGGHVLIESTITGTGYATSARPTTTTTLNNVQAAGDQLLQSAGAVIITGNVGGGVFVGSPPVGTTTSTGAAVDLDGDGVPDVSEGSGSITNFGSAPALSIGGGSTATTIGTFLNAAGTNPDTDVGLPAGSTNAFGVIIRGSVSGQGVYDTVPATGLQIGTNNGAGVSIAGGVRVVGSVSAQSFEANATAIDIKQGSIVPEIRNENFIAASISHSVVATNFPAGIVATGIQIESGANVGSISNFGTLEASANGDHMTAVAVRDASGSVTNILNEGVISAGVTPVTAGLVLPTGSTTALDLSMTGAAPSTTGVTLTQQVNPNPIAVEVSTTTNSAGVVSTTAALTTATATTTTTTTTTTAGVTTTTTTTTPTFPQIVGDVLLGNGTNTVNILGGSVTGALSLGYGGGTAFTLGQTANASGQLAEFAIYQGDLSYTGQSLALNVANGSLINTKASTLGLSSLHVGGNSLLYAAIDPSNTTTDHTLYNVSGTATFDSGAQIGIFLRSPLFTETTYTVVQAANLVDNSGGTLALNQVPFVLVGTETTNTANGTIAVNLRRRTAAEAGLNPAESSSLNAVYTSLTNDPVIEGAVLGQYTRSSFLNVYDQLLPDYAGGIFQLTLAASDAVTRATSRVNDIENPSGTRGAWAEEVAFGVNRSRSSESAGYQGGGFGFVGGLETGGAGLGAFGLTGSFLTGDVKNPHSPGDNLSSFSEGEGGAYWQAQLGGLRADARVGGGYLLYANRRELLLKDASGNVTLDRSSKASSSGYTATGHFGLGYQTGQIGGIYFRPQVHGDYFYLNQGSYTEHNGAETSGADGFDLSVATRNGNEASGTAGLVTGVTFGQGFKWRPELEVGYRNVFSGTSGATTANFTNGTPFTIDPNSVKGGGPTARLDVKADTDFYELNFEAGAEERTHFTEADVRLSVRVLF